MTYTKMWSVFSETWVDPVEGELTAKDSLFYMAESHILLLSHA
jgi:hypothetical protein